MADYIPHDRAPPGIEMDPEFEPLPLSIRPFDPATYHPEVHVCTGGPPTTRARVTFVPLHLQGIHFLFIFCNGDSHAFRGYGTTSMREWYMELRNTVHHIVDEAGFSTFCMGLSSLIASRPLLGALVERWRDTTDSLHFSTAGEMTITPIDFSMLTGITVRGHLIPYDTDKGEDDSDDPQGDRVLRPGLLHVLRFGGLVSCPILRLGRRRLGYIIWLWVYAYFLRLAPKPRVEIPPMLPYSHRYDGRCQRSWQPWVVMPDGVKDQFASAREASRFWILLDGPVCRAWFLGERFLRQSLGWPEPVVPMLPSTYMRVTERYTMQEMINFKRGWDADFFRLEGDYTAFIQTYLMLPLTSAHRGERARAPTIGERAGGSRASRAHDRRGSQTRQKARWPELPASLT
ncbi:hypothetical protein CsSME_00038774 [Camellia sinensis var. sinensis]